MAIHVREARPQEYEEAGKVTADAYREFVRPGESAWEDYLRHIADVAGRAERTTVLVAVEDGRILGTATIEMDGRIDQEGDGPLAPGEVHIRMLGVSQDARGRGVARALMEASEQRARERGRTLVTLHTTRRMPVAQRMYERLGYERGPDRRFDDGFVLLSFSKRL
jgi:ribosomal protein S18 acetylase RimI-like enzyme